MPPTARACITAFSKAQFNVGRMLLHAAELQITHPHSGQPLTLIAPLSGDFARLLGELGWADALPAAWLGDTSAPAQG